MYQKQRIALVIPAHNEEKLIGDTLRGVPELVDDIYVIDDGSTDATSECARKVGDRRVVVIRNEKNEGVGAAIVTGYKVAFERGADIAVVVGGDNQMDLAEIENFLRPIIEGAADYTKGNRFLDPSGTFERMPTVRLFGNALISAMCKLASGYFKVYDAVDGYTALSRYGFEQVRWKKVWKGYGYPLDFLIRLNTAGLRVMDVPRRAIYLSGVRQSQIHGFSYAIHVFPMLLRGFFRRLLYKYILRDFHPLVFFYLLGLFLVPAGFVFGLYLVWQQASGIGVSGPRAVLCALAILIGVQSFFFAIAFEILHQESPGNRRQEGRSKRQSL